MIVCNNGKIERKSFTRSRAFDVFKRNEFNRVVINIRDVTFVTKKKMMKQVFITADKLAEEIRNIQKCLQCTIW